MPGRDGRISIYAADGTESRMWPVDAMDAIARRVGSLVRPTSFKGLPALNQRAEEHVEDPSGLDLHHAKPKPKGI